MKFNNKTFGKVLLVALTIAEKWNGSVPHTVLGDSSNVVPIFSVNSDNFVQKPQAVRSSNTAQDQ